MREHICVKLIILAMVLVCEEGGNFTRHDDLGLAGQAAEIVEKDGTNLGRVLAGMEEKSTIGLPLDDTGDGV